MPRYEMTVDVQYVYEVEADSIEEAESFANFYDQEYPVKYGKTETVVDVSVAEMDWFYNEEGDNNA